MGYSLKDWQKAILNLLEKTSKNEIKWEQSDVYKGDAWNIVDMSFMTSIKSKIYTISKTRSKNFIDEDEFVWNVGYNFSIFTGNKYSGYDLIASSPDSISLETLFEKAMANRAYSENALSDLLDDGEEEDLL